MTGQPPDQPDQPVERNQPDQRGRAAVDLSSAYAELQQLLVHGPDVTEFLEQVARLASGITSPASSVGVTLRRDGQLVTAATSSELAGQIDEIQYSNGRGPCLHSVRTGEVVHMADLATDSRWDEYRLRAMAQGLRSSLSIPLQVGGETVGALNLYLTHTHPFSAGEAAAATAFARQASAALAVVQRHTSHTRLEQQFERALSSRAVIDQALGIIMGQRRCTASEAFTTLRQVSQNRNVKLADVAAELITSVTGQPPEPPRPFLREG